MAQAKCFDMSGRETGEVLLSDSIFASEIKSSLLHQVVVAYMANARQGNAKTKVRSEVSGGGVKPWRQKKTGRARAGSIRSPIWVGGGTVFGPQPRSYRQVLSTGTRRGALVSALSAKFQAGEIVFVDKIELAEPKTKLVAGMLKSLGITSSSALIVTAEPDKLLWRVSKNMPKVSLTFAAALNPLDLLQHEKVVMVRAAIARLEQRVS